MPGVKKLNLENSDSSPKDILPCSHVLLCYGICYLEAVTVSGEPGDKSCRPRQEPHSTVVGAGFLEAH